ARLVMLLARAVHVAHQKGIVHRDLKPANVLLAPPSEEPALNSAWGVPKITDFGLAKLMDGGRGQTAAGAVLGTPSYMAPEQASAASKDVGPATDTYALGAILYECLTGTPPFRGASAMHTMLQVIGSEPVSPRRLRPEIPEELEAVCLRCLRKSPA